MSERKKPRILVRFTAQDGSEWTVWDATWSKAKHHRRPHGDPTATQRVFVNADGLRRAYKFKPSDSRVTNREARMIAALGLARFVTADGSVAASIAR